MQYTCNSNDIPPTDAELERIYGGEYKPEPHDAACNAIRAIHYIDFEPETAQAIIAVLSEKMRACQFTKGKVQAIELLEEAFQSLD